MTDNEIKFVNRLYWEQHDIYEHFKETLPKDKLGRKYRTKDTIKKLHDILRTRDRNLLSRSEIRDYPNL